MYKVPSEQIRHIALIEETRTAIYLIHEGLISINRLNGANDFAHLPILLLSNGFERLLKIIICLDYMERNGELPMASSFRPYEHHKLTQLFDKVIQTAEEWNYGKDRKASKDDMVFLEKDVDLKKVIILLEKYADAGRYYNIDIILGKRRSSKDDPLRSFESYCFDVFTRQPDWQKKITGENLGQKLDGSIRYINQQIIILLQRFARALCRMFTLGKLGKTGKQLIGIIGNFLFLQDEDLGNVFPQ